MSAPRYLPGCAVVWRGPSLVDGRPIAVVVVGDLVYVVSDGADASPHTGQATRMAQRDMQEGRIRTRDPFEVPGYVLGYGSLPREEVPSAVWAALDG